MRWPAIFFPQKAAPVLDTTMVDEKIYVDAWQPQPPIRKPVRYLPPHQHLSAEPVFAEIVFTPITWVQPPPIWQRPKRFVHPGWHLQADRVLVDLVAEDTFVDAWHQPPIIRKYVRYLPPHQHLQAEPIFTEMVFAPITWVHLPPVIQPVGKYFKASYHMQADPVLTDAMRPEIIFVDAWHQPPIIKKRYPEFYIRGPLNDSALVQFEGIFPGTVIDGWFSREILPPGYRLVGVYRSRGYLVTYVFKPLDRSGNPLLLVI